MAHALSNRPNCTCVRKTLQKRGRTHGAGCARPWFRTAEPLGNVVMRIGLQEKTVYLISESFKQLHMIHESHRMQAQEVFVEKREIPSSKTENMLSNLHTSEKNTTLNDNTHLKKNCILEIYHNCKYMNNRDSRFLY